MPRVPLSHHAAEDDDNCEFCSTPWSATKKALLAGLFLALVLGGSLAAWLLASKPSGSAVSASTPSYGDPDCPQMAGMVMPCPLSPSATPAPTPGSPNATAP